MRFNKSVMKTILSLILIGIISTSAASGQERINEVSLWRLPLAEDPNELEAKVLNELRSELEEKNIKVNQEAEIQLFISAKETEIPNEIILSITQMQALPEKAIEFAAENELFYKNWNEWVSNKKLPKEGKFVREMITKEIMYKFRMPVDDTLIKCKRWDLKKEIHNYVKNLNINQNKKD